MSTEDREVIERMRRFYASAGGATVKPDQLERLIEIALRGLDAESMVAAEQAARIKAEAERDEARAELEATKKAKAENDERFMVERDDARARLAEYEDRDHSAEDVIAQAEKMFDEEPMGDSVRSRLATTLALLDRRREKAEAKLAEAEGGGDA